MDTKPVVEELASIPIGTYIIWGMVICGVIAAIVTVIVKMYKIFEKYRDLKDKNEERLEQLNKHEEVLDEIQRSLGRIEDNFKVDHEVQKRRLKHEITNACNDAMRDGVIRLSTLRSIEEMFEDYEKVYDGNSWVHTLVNKTRMLEVEVDIDDE